MPTEQQLLNLIRKLTPKSRKYLRDDAAIVENNLIVTTDTLVENTHFTTKTYKLEEIGWKAMAVNLSDIAAMGGRPLYALVSLSISKKIKEKWIKNLYKGILSCAKKYKTQIIGGNLARSKEINITITIIGETVVRAGFKPAPTGKRSNAKPGDIVFVTGMFGNPKKKPIPQITLGQKIVRSTKRVALMDASDGLADCLIQISHESKVKIIVNENKIPIYPRASTNQALYCGEDYELVGTVSNKDSKKLNKIKNIKIIGTVTKGKGAFVKQKNNNLVKLDMEKGYKHFL